MEIIIVICLLVVIALLLQDKIIIGKRVKKIPTQEKVNPKLPAIMGQPKPKQNLSPPKPSKESHFKDQMIDPSNLDIEFDENEITHQIENEELDDVFSNVPDWQEEEEEWSRYRIISDNDGFAQGVTFEELGNVESFLETNKHEISKNEITVAIVQKLQGTELFSLLENSIVNASIKISKLLDSSLLSETDSNSSILRKKDFKDFDIGKFL